MKLVTNPLNHKGCCCIYLVRNKINNKIYVGQTVNLYQRINQHRKVKEKTKISRAYDKYGFENFEFFILETVSQEHLNERERYWIHYYKAFNDDIGYNICTEPGKTTLGRKRPDHEKELFSRLLKGRFVGEKSPSWGIKRSPETLENMRRASELRGIKVVKIDMITKQIIEEFPSIRAACRNVSALSANLINAIKEKGTCKGYYWDYKEGSEGKDYSSYVKSKHTAHDTQRKPIVQLTMNGEFLNIYTGVRKAADSYNKSKSTLQNCLNKREGRYSAWGYKWMYLDEFYAKQPDELLDC